MSLSTSGRGVSYVNLRGGAELTADDGTEDVTGADDAAELGLEEVAELVAEAPGEAEETSDGAC